MTYYWKDGSDTYHTQPPSKCHLNNHPNLGWHRGDRKPSDKTDKCNQCKKIEAGG